MADMRIRMTAAIVVVLACALVVGSAAAAAATSLPPVKHVFIIVLENESESVSFGAASPAPYLAQTLPSQGAFVPNYYGIGHNSLDNYIAMIGGQPPNPTTQSDCPTFQDMSTDTTSSFGAVNGSGCLYPAGTPTIVNQLEAKGLTWGAYMDEMGQDPAREAATCPAPVAGQADGTETAESSSPYDEYAERHDPFMYYHSITNNTADCQAHVVNLNRLPAAMSSAATTPNYVFITPDLCNDGHNNATSGSPCGPGEPGGLAQINTFLQTWVPKITSSAAFKQDGLLLVTFDEAATSDASSCCGEVAGPGAASPGGTGPGGGDVGAVMLSPFIKPGTVTQTAYNHYSMLGSIEDLFGLSHLGYAQLPGETDFGSDIFTNYTPSKPVAKITVPALLSAAATTPKVTLKLGATTTAGTTLGSYAVQALDRSVKHATWHTIVAKLTRASYSYSVKAGHTYAFRVAATDSRGLVGAYATSGAVVVPSSTKPAGGKYSKHWTTVKVKNAWEGHAIRSSTAGATFTLRYTGSNLALIGESSKAGGRLKVTVDGRSRTLRLHSRKSTVRKLLATFKLKAATHRVKLSVLSGTVALEGYAITNRTS